MRRPLFCFAAIVRCSGSRRAAYEARLHQSCQARISTLIINAGNCQKCFISLILFFAMFSLHFPVPAFAGPPSYVIGSIPSQSVFRGTPVSFQLQSAMNLPPTFGYSVSPGSAAPQGRISLDKSTGLFSYTPAQTDRFDFWLTFANSVLTSIVESQTVHFTLPPETDLLQSSTAVPDPAGTDYLLVTQSQNPTKEMFNGTQRSTWNVEISGKTVIFDSSTPSYGGLYTRFHNRPDMKALSIYAETFIVRSSLKLPGTNLTVYAREIRFEDTAGTASIDTTPVAYPGGATTFQNGSAGQKGGDITLWIKTFSAVGNTIRFIANGGNGQDAGEGQAGAPKPYFAQPEKGDYFNIFLETNGSGRSLIRWPYGKSPYGWVKDEQGSWLKPPFPEVVSNTPSNCHEHTLGQPPKWPEDGNDAISPGMPGNGGAGGTIAASTTIPQGTVQLLGGASGQPGKPRLGGPPQEPVFSVWLRDFPGDGTDCLNNTWNAQVIARHTSVKGKDVPSILGVAGANGILTLQQQTNSAPWLHPYFLRAVIAHAKDAYRMGNLSYAQQVLHECDNLLTNYGTFPMAFAPDFQQMQIDIVGLLHRIANNMDYFGNTAGWVPLLSLEATMSAFSSEVNADVPVLFLSQWLEAKADQNQKDVAALQDAITNAKTEAANAATDMDTALQAVPNLQYQAAQLASQLQDFQSELQAREAYLIALAQNNVEDQKKVPFWKQAVRVIGTVAELVPAYQPVLGTVADREETYLFGHPPVNCIL